jgi:hypothetical protein
MKKRVGRLAWAGFLGITVVVGPEGQVAMANETDLTQAAFARLDTAMTWLVMQGDLAAAYRLGAWYAPPCYDGTDLAI